MTETNSVPADSSSPADSTSSTDKANNKAADKAIRLDQFLKFCLIVDSGGRAKWLVQNGDVMVNGAVETRRRRQLVAGDVVEVDGQQLSFDDFLATKKSLSDEAASE